MKVLGVRIEPTKARYAILEKSGDDFSLLNADTESRLVFPANLTAPDERANWLYRELDRLIHEHNDVEKICIKTNEYTRGDTKPKRTTAHLEGVVLLFGARNNLPVDLKLYTSLGTRSANVREDAENRVGRTAMYWDNKMADAVVAAWNGART